jgi:transposase InsO family protein/transposase-like protein
MYSLEDRMRAVQLYIESGCSEGAVIRELGYPSHMALRNWYKEYFRNGWLHATSAPKPRYTEQEKATAVAYFETHKTTLTQTCRAMGYPSRYVLRKWILEINPSLLNRKASACDSGKRLVRYSQEEKRTAVVAMLVDGIPDYKVAAQYGVCRATLYNWKRQLLGKDAIAVMAKKATTAVKDPGTVQTTQTKEDLEAEIANLQAQIQYLKMERDALEKAAELLKKADGINLTQLENSEKAEVIDAMRSMYRLKDLLKLFHISKSSYFYSIQAASRDKYKDLRQKLHTVFDSVDGRYGYRRIHAMLKKSSIVVSEKVVRRLMKEEGLIVHRAKRKKYSSYAGEISPEVANIIKRDFHADAPNTKWLTDITEFSLPAGKVYLSPIIDCFDGMAVSWSIGTSPSADLVNIMLDGAVSRLKEGEQPVVHSDRGAHYRWPGWINRINEAGLTRSMSKKGCSPDNAACEGFFGRLKNEMFYGRSWLDVSIEEFISRLDGYIRWYNNDRIKESLGWMSPVEYRKSLGLAG